MTRNLGLMLDFASVIISCAGRKHEPQFFFSLSQFSVKRNSLKKKKIRVNKVEPSYLHHSIIYSDFVFDEVEQLLAIHGCRMVDVRVNDGDIEKI